MDSIGGHLDAFTAKECVSFSAVVLDQHFTQALDVLSDLVLNPLFETPRIFSRNKASCWRRSSRRSCPEYLLHELFTAKFWKNHPLGRPILGTRQTVSAFDRRAILSQFQRSYQPSRLVIAVAGHLAHQRVADQVRKRFGALKDHNHRPADHRPVIQPHITLKNKEHLEQAHLCLGVPSYPLALMRQRIGGDTQAEVRLLQEFVVLERDVRLDDGAVVGGPVVVVFQSAGIACGPGPPRVDGPGGRPRRSTILLRLVGTLELRQDGSAVAGADGLSGAQDRAGRADGSSRISR